MQPKIVAEGQHHRYTEQGAVPVGKFNRPISATCLECSRQDPLRVVSDEPISEQECDAVLTEYLEELGWDCDEEGDVCPACAET